MKRFWSEEQIREDISAALTSVAEKHGLTIFSPLFACMALDGIASPLKYLIQASPLTRDVGVSGVDAFVTSRLARAVFLLQSPDSVIVNPLMEAIAAALYESKKPLSLTELERRAIRIFLKEKKRMSNAAVRRAKTENAAIDSAFRSGLGYLERGEIVEKVEGDQYKLAWPFEK